MKKYLLLLIFSISICTKITQAQTIYTQNFGSGTSFPAGWSSNAVGDQVVNSTGSNSSGDYTLPATPGPVINASGGSNIMMRDCNATSNSTVTITFNGISTIGKTNLILYFGRRETSSFNNAVKLEASIDGGSSFSSISNDVRQIPIAATATWTTTNYALPASMANVSNLIFRFSYTPVSTTTTCSNSSGNFRIDDFYLGENGVLPVKLNSFKAESLVNSVELNWETTEEINVNRFEIERSLDAKEFYKIETITAKNQPSFYSLSDKNASIGTNYYRLKMIDNDGSFEYSKIISANFGSELQIFSLLENPVLGNEIRFNSQNHTIENLRLTSITGQNIDFELNKEAFSFRLKPKEKLNSGVYLLTIFDSKYTKTIRVLME